MVLQAMRSAIPHGRITHEAIGRGLQVDVYAGVDLLAALDAGALCRNVNASGADRACLSAPDLPGYLQGAHQGLAVFPAGTVTNPLFHTTGNFVLEYDRFAQRFTY